MTRTSKRVEQRLCSGAVGRTVGRVDPEIRHATRLPAERGYCLEICIIELKLAIQGRADRHQTCFLGHNFARWTTVPTRMLNVCGSVAAAA